MPWGRLKTREEFDSVLQSIREIGFEGVGVEFSILPRDLKSNPGLLPGMMRKTRLENGGTYSRARLADIAWAKKSETPLFWASVYEKSFPVALRRLASFAKKTKRERIITALHNELRSSVETEDEIVRALNRIPEMNLCIDTAHGAGAGVDCIGLIERFPQRISLVHLKDLREILPKYKVRFKRDFVNVGTGALDLKPIVKKLEETGYKGQLMLEIEALEGQEPALAVREGFEYIRRLL